MRRRDLIALSSAVAALRIAPAWAQKSALPVIGFLSSASASDYADRADAFHRGLAEIGYAEGRNVGIDYRWMNGRNDLLPQMTAELLDQRVAVIVAGGSTAAVIAKRATSTVPIVFTMASDPVRAGLVASLSRPGGNATGGTNLNQELAAKQLEVLKEVLPSARRIGLLINPTNTRSAEIEVKLALEAASKLGLELQIASASTEQEIETAVASLGQAGVAGLLIGADAFFNSMQRKLGTLTARHRLPAIHNSPEFATAGGLASLGGDGRAIYRIAGTYAGRILKGERPSDLPAQQATTIRLRLNLKAAKALGIEVPTAILVRADEVIE